MSTPGTGAVELRLAWEWTCESCGRDVFCRAVSISPESLVPEDWAMLDDLDATPGDYVARPESVTCPHCGAGFAVAADGAEAEDGDDDR